MSLYMQTGISRDVASFDVGLDIMRCRTIIPALVAVALLASLLLPFDGENTDNSHYPVAYAASPKDSGQYPPPLHQHEVPPSSVRCNEPRDLYLAGLRPLCLLPGTYEALLSRGIDLVSGHIHTAASYLGLTAEEEKWLRDHPVIRVAYDPGWLPIEYLDEYRKLSGITARYVAEFEKITGADFQPVQMGNWTPSITHMGAIDTTSADFRPIQADNWAGALEAIKERDADVMFMATPTAKSAQYMGFTSVHYTVESVLISADEKRLSMNEQDLRILTVRGHAIEEWLEENYPEINYASVGSFADGFEMMLNGEADAFADVWEVVDFTAMLESMSIYNAGSTGHSYEMAIGYRNDQPLLGSILQKTLDYIPTYTLERLQGAPPKGWIITDGVLRHLGETIQITGSVYEEYDGPARIAITDPDGHVMEKLSIQVADGRFGAEAHIHNSYEPGFYGVTLHDEAGSFIAHSEFYLARETDNVTRITITPGSADAECSNASGCYYMPRTVTIGVGDIVVWRNADETAHGIAGMLQTEDGLVSIFDSDRVFPGAEFMHKFEHAGEYQYYGFPHPWMTGRIIVEWGGF